MSDINKNKTSFWFDANDFKRHEFQIVIDTLALASSLPLRVLDWQELSHTKPAKLWYLEHENINFDDEQTNTDCTQKLKVFCQEVKALFKNPKQNIIRKSLTEIPPALSHLAVNSKTNLSQRFWLNYLSNPPSLHLLLRSVDEWLWFMTVWFYVNQTEIKACAENQKPICAFYMPELELHFRWLDLAKEELDLEKDETKKYMLVIGMLYTTPDIRTEQSLDKNIEGISDKFNAFYSCYCKGSITHPPEIDTIHRLAHHSTPIPSKEIERRIKIIMDCINSMNRTLEMNIKNPRYQDYYAITIIYFRLFQYARDIYWVKAKPEQDSPPFNLRLYFHFTHRTDDNLVLVDINSISDESITYNSVRVANSVVLAALEDKKFFDKFDSSPKLFNKLFLLSIIVNETDKQNLNEKELNELKQQIRKLKKTLTTSFVKIDETINSSKNGLRGIRSNMLNSWLQKHYAGSSHDINDAHTKRIYQHLCHTLLRELRADGVKLYKVNYAKSTLQCIGYAYSDPELIKKDLNLIREIETITEENRKKYPIYKVTDSDEADKFQNQHGWAELIIAPIKFQGKVYGVLEIKGLKPDLFQWISHLTLANLANIIAEYFYNQQLIFALQKITKDILNSTFTSHTDFEKNIKSGKETYKKICSNLSEIFLANGVLLWLQDPQNTRHYLLSGTTYPDYDTIDCYNHGKKNDYLSIANNLFYQYTEKQRRFITVSINKDEDEEIDEENQKETGHYHLGKSYVDDKKVKNNLRQYIRKYNYKSSIHFVITKDGDSGNDNSDNILGYVCLYYRAPHSEATQNWKNIIELVNKQLIVAFGALETFGNLRNEEQALLYHEIKQDSWASLTIAKALEATVNYAVNHLIPKESSTINDIKKRISNLKGVNKRLQWKLNLWESRKEISLRSMFGGVAIDFNELESPLIIRDVYASKKTIFTNKGSYVDFVDMSKTKNSPVIYMQRDMLYTLIQNLFDNAAKYCEPNSSVDIAFEKLERDRNYKYVLTISNISKPLGEFERNNFNPFNNGSRSSQARLTDPTGDGIGLYTIARICDFYKIINEFKYEPHSNNLGKYTFSFKFPHKLFKKPA